ncbi:rab11 family-interacting protein 1 isoform X2 [Scophthalmus maximus]|uniref:rab11 family-interacting protein 1 isoform X2 n=1 Tax=Scophthalmus maximus TaxID=52904 RepID=UPI001FA8A52F|nr:rab11 family-interacting protein 1 isoform X2 [Scophthalmus maximus]
MMLLGHWVLFCVLPEWYRLNSKTGKKEKERGDIQVTIQFTRNNLTASMYDLVMKDKGASTFSKLKERMRGKRRSIDDDSSPANLPGGSLTQVRQRLPSDGGGEEDYEDDEGGEARRSKMRTFFLRGKLRKSSDTRSSTSLGSESSESSSRGGSLSPTAGISVVVSDLSNSPSNSSNLTADNSPEHTATTSPSLKCDFGDEVGEITIAVPQPTVCVNGSHAYRVQPLDPGSGKPVDSLGLGLLQKSLPLSVSLQSLSPRASATDPQKGPAGDGRRWSFDKPGEEEKAAIAAALEQGGPMQGEDEERLGTAESESHGKKQKRNLFSHGRSESPGTGPSPSKDGSEEEEKHKGWFGSKDSNSKPSSVVSPKLESRSRPHPSPPLPSSNHPPGAPVDLAPLVSPLHHTNPFCHSQTTSPPISPCNPFFSVLQHNPFFEDTPNTRTPAKPSLPPLPYLSSARPPISQLFPQTSNLNNTLTLSDPTAEEDSIFGTGAKGDPMAKIPAAPTEGEKSANPFMSAGELEPDSEWDESFEAFAAGRLQSPEDPTTDCETQQNTPSDRPLENCDDKGASVPITDPDQNTNMDDALLHQPWREVISEAHEATSQVTNTDAFAQFLETIPEQMSLESDNITLNTSADSATLDACTETNQANSTTKANDSSSTNMLHGPSHASSVQLNSSSPDPGSSGIGSSAEEDFLSCLSSYSDKFSASSCEEAEARFFESNIQGFEQSFEPAVAKSPKPSDSEEDFTDRSNDRTVFDVPQQGSDERVGSKDSRAPQSPVLTPEELVITARETETEGADAQTLNIPNVPDLLPKPSELQLKSGVCSQSDDESGGKGIDEINSSLVDFSKEFVDGSVNNGADVRILATPDDVFSSTLPSLYIRTSSPDVMQSSWDSSFGNTNVRGQGASQCSPVPFGAFCEASPGQDFDNTLLHTRVSDLSSSSFLQSLYVSSDSQDYQTCASHQSSDASSVSEPDKTQRSANSTLCGEPSDIQTTADAALGLEDSPSASTSPIRETTQTDRFEEYCCAAADDNTATIETQFMIGGDFGLHVLPAAPADSEKSCDPKWLGEGGVEGPHVVLDDGFSKGPEARSAALHRSQSEGTLTPAFDELLLPSFGSDPGATQGSSSAQPDPALACLTSFAPSLTPRSFPVALCSFPPLANAFARSPPSAARAAAPQPRETQPPPPPPQQQAASQQSSPHPVKPLTTALQAEEKRTEGRSVLATGLEKLKSTIHPGRSSQISEQATDRRKSLTEGAGSYYHLTHSELVALLVQREADLERRKAEFERQRVLLAKREVELRRLKPQVKDLEDYIDTLLVRIMEQKPTLLQVRSKFK